MVTESASASASQVGFEAMTAAARDRLVVSSSGRCRGGIAIMMVTAASGNLCRGYRVRYNKQRKHDAKQ